jgi:hypothetical protein
MIFKFPSQFTSDNVYSVWLTFSKIGENNVTIDLRELEYVDAEGTNYLIILPFLMTKNNHDVQILLPSADKDVHKLLNDCGVLDILKNNFTTLQQGQLFLFHESFSYNQNRTYSNRKFIPQFKSLIFDSKQQTQIFHQLSENYDIFKWNINLSQRAASCLSELIKNIYDHSEQNFGCITMHFRNVGKKSIPYLFICVTDLGIGVKNSLLKSDLFNNSNYKRRGDNFFIGAALTQGVTSTNSKSRGLGLPLVLKQSNKLIFSSGCCRASITKDDTDPNIHKKYKLKRIKRMTGTSIVSLIKGFEI